MKGEHFTVRDLLALAAAGALDLPEQRRVQEHLRCCEACRAEYDGWTRLAGTLSGLPTPQAPPRLVLQTQRLLKHAAALRASRGSRIGLAVLILFSWMFAFVSFGLVRMLDSPLARRLDVSSTTVWVAYIGVTWLATAVAAGLLGRHWRQQGKTV